METTEQRIAEWMVGEIEFRGLLRQEEAIAHVREHFGEQYVFVNEKGNESLAKEVKKAFRKLHGGRVAWDRDGFFWGMDLDGGGSIGRPTAKSDGDGGG